MKIREYREEYRPSSGFEYPEFFTYFEKAVGSIWRPSEVVLDKDLQDWRNATEQERRIIGGILNSFVLLETHIGQYWVNTIPRMFPKHEIVSAALLFGAFERIHAEAYAYLSDTLGVTDYAAFLKDNSAREKLDTFIRYKDSDKVSVAAFSGFGEGVSLYSSFATLLAPTRDARFLGLQQILSWSISDEMQHSDMGCLLFRKVVEEEGVFSEEIKAISEAADAVVDSEYNYIDSIFEDETQICGMTKSALKEYILYRVNDRLTALGMNPRFTYDRDRVESITSWFHPMTIGVKANDAFSIQKNGDAYDSGFRFNLGASKSAAMRTILADLDNGAFSRYNTSGK